MALGALSHIAFTVSDLDRSAKFYDLVLDFLGYTRWPAVAGQAKWKKPGVGIVLLYAAQNDRVMSLKSLRFSFSKAFTKALIGPLP